MLEGARQSRTAVVSVELLHHLSPLRRGSFPLPPTELTVEFAELLVEVAVAGWSRQCLPSLRRAVVSVPDETVTVLAVSRGFTATFLASDDTLCQ